MRYGFRRRRTVDWYALYQLAKDLAVDLREVERNLQKTEPFRFESLDRWEEAMAKGEARP